MYQYRNVFSRHGGGGNARFSRFSFRIKGLRRTGTFVALMSPRTEARHRGSLKRKRQTYWHAFAEDQFQNDSHIPGWASGWCCKRWATRQELARTGWPLQRPPTRLEEVFRDTGRVLARGPWNLERPRQSGPPDGKGIADVPACRRVWMNGVLTGLPCRCGETPLP